MPRRIDHLVVTVRDLDAAGDFYHRLGFMVGARNRHPWGTENRLVQFRSSFIELITVGTDEGAIPPHAPGRFSFGAYVRDALRQRQGLAMLVLDSADAKADAARFAKAGIGDFEPFFFERKGRRPDGSETHVAFTLAFAVDAAAPDAGFFVCQQHYPENFWNPQFQAHPNGGRNIAGVTLAAAHPPAHEAFLAAFTGGVPQGDGVFPLDGGRIDVVPAEQGDGARFTAFAVAVPDIDAQADRLGAAGIAFERAGDRLTIPAETAYGVEIRFERAE
ncbi:Glyoxalase-like domain-containing protein [Aureimonas altamirensis DSM 21988]|uniref:Glyoxalase-like domain-containing protein n=1 Tax=Aureimonas altamirensis DSM 21988 TaxID=1121026 RepID=A0ABY1IHH4_9HYPH|nr:VOC family protein [Aureimonas altamirensis]SHJ17856.1 Glyoxalase-like domain-containing protein [Aureimonas altamirensis DSM 21988]